MDFKCIWPRSDVVEEMKNDPLTQTLSRYCDLDFYPRGVIAKLHFVSIMPVSPGGLDQSVFTVIDNCVARLISMVVAQLVNVQ